MESLRSCRHPGRDCSPQGIEDELSAHHFSPGRRAVKSRWTRSGAGSATGSGTEVRFFLCRYRPAKLVSRISWATRLRLTVCPKPQLGVNAQHAVVLTVFGVDLAEHGGRRLVLGPPDSLDVGEPPVAGRAGDLEYPAQPLNTESPGMGGDEVPAAGPHFNGMAK